ncbi:hypothetical protein AU252_20305 [Pseudarthrobacter sulfonivorans]|uniref:Uncharacterized protein n=2 Tax=Pseudarthrobacter sulfonivorans TaxID=121292 RepID=A0A0U3QFG6_9MICC|nr:hypothetical protein AU252_20305 [Pseudarthrobacter sulfonivorans]
MTGSFRVSTRSGTQYLICLDAPRHIVRLPGESQPAPDYADVQVAHLRQDAEAIPLLQIVTLTVGQRGFLALDIVGGGTVTARDTSQVVEILPLLERVQISDESAAEIGQAARSLGWARILHIPDTAPPVFVLDASAVRTLSIRSYDQLEARIATALGNAEFLLDAAEHFDDGQLSKMREL